ncbi:glutathione S-transferase [Thelephora terrestris]|uniref:Glutathione S-transferase n=1 Tax=Thelephora terrestris TaxID=56493 RepID=A0A9P6L0X0_9AGAM|nr:glutathione S-transferase [Thelephora terrestris]
MASHVLQSHPRATGLAEETVKSHQADCEIVLHGGWFCPFTQKCWVALEERGIPYKYVETNPFNKDPALLALNPKGLIPALTYQGKPLHDSHVILEFLEDAYPQHKPQLRPTDPYNAAQARIWVDVINKYIVPGYFRIFHAQTPELQAAAMSEWLKYLQCFADKIRGPYFFGEEFSIVDLSLTPWIIRDWILVENRGFNRENVSPKFAAYCQLIVNRPNVLKTFSNKECYEAIYALHLSGQMKSSILEAIKSGRPLP